jgi:leucyl aminopeptidase
MMTLAARHISLFKASADLVACFVFQDRQIRRQQLAHIRSGLSAGARNVLRMSPFQGKERETLLLHPDNGASPRLLLVGLGEPSKFTTDTLRRASAAVIRTASGMKLKSVAMLEPDPRILESLGSGLRPEITGTALGEGALLSGYRYAKYITSKDSRSTVTTLSILSEDRDRKRLIESGLRYARIVCEGTVLARDLANAPPNEIYPDSLARRAVAAGRRNGFRVTVLNEKAIRARRMGGLVAVSRGSNRPPRFIIMEYNRARKRIPIIILIGKGVTFDAGGISIKPAQGMAEMKMDMSGAAAVIATMQTISRLRLPFRVIGLVPATENLLGGSAMKPGDILTHYNGKTSEVDNTDAEGRLILADALAFAGRYKPDLVIDLATLTGACVVALGQFATGMMGNDQARMDRLKEAGERTYERVWQLPMFEEYDKLIKSEVADVKNVGPRWAGAITAAMFLKRFVGDYPWIHLDIAGTAIIEEAQAYIPKGGSGVGVRLLTDFLKHWHTH